MPVAANKSSIPFAGTVTDSLELMRKVWGMSGLPAIPSPASMAQFAQSLPQALPNMLTPTLDVGELDKRIADLRAVEQWLNLNTGMLRTAIQTLEVQRNTIATLRSFSGTMLAAMPGAARAATTATAAVAAPSPAPAAPVRRASSARRHSAKVPSPSLASMPLNPAVWWAALQDQFAKAAAAATEGSTGAPPASRTAPRKNARKAGAPKRR